MQEYKKREKFSEILKYIDVPEIVVLHGARQVGKTTLMKMTMRYLEDSGKGKYFYFDLEDERFLELCNSGVENIVNYIKARKSATDKSGKTFIFIDEIQYLDNPTSLLKLFYDHYKDDFKLIVSGSSSFAIKSKFKDSLVGRVIDLEIFGLSFAEFLDFKGLTYNLDIDSALSDSELIGLFKEYSLFGSYPQVVLADNIEFKEIYLRGIIDKYIHKDIRDLAAIKDLTKFNSLLKLLASQVGGMVNVSELANTLGMARQTIEQYLFMLESTYIIRLIRPFSRNSRSELSKMPKVYFEDGGILNILRNRRIPDDVSGEMFENSVYAVLRRIVGSGDLYFWRTIGKKEVDFVVDSGDMLSFEVKLKYQDKLMKNLLYFAKEYKSDNRYCVTLDKGGSGKVAVDKIYPWRLPTIVKGMDDSAVEMNVD